MQCMNIGPTVHYFYRRGRVVNLVIGCTNNSSSSEISPPPEPGFSSLSGTLIDPNNILYHPVINHLFRIAGKNRRLVEALRRGAHRTGTDRHQMGNDAALGETGSNGNYTGNDRKRAKNRRYRTDNVDHFGSGERQPGIGEKQTGSGEKKTGSASRRLAKSGENNGICGPETAAAVEQRKKPSDGGVLPAVGVCSRVKWMASGEWQRCSMLDVEVLLDQLRRIKRWLGQREPFSSTELRDIERRAAAVESHLRY